MYVMCVVFDASAIGVMSVIGIMFVTSVLFEMFVMCVLCSIIE